MELLRDARGRAGLSQRELARRAGTSQAMVARIERGHQSPSLDTMERLVRACGLELRVDVVGPQATARPAAGRGRLLVWRSGGAAYAFPLETVQGMVDYSPPRRLPGQRPEAGVAVARGAVIAVIDAAGRLGIDAAAPPSEIVVVDTAAGPCGVAVERTQSVTGSVAVTLPPPRAAAAAYVTGLALVEGEWVAVLDPDRFCRMVEPAAP